MLRKKLIGIVIMGIVIMIVMIAGCAKTNPTETSMPHLQDFLEDPQYFIYELSWVDNDLLMAKMAQRKIKLDGQAIGKVILWNRQTYEQRLIYEGKEMPGVLPHGSVYGNGLIYIYDGMACIVFKEDTFEVMNKIIIDPETYGFNPSINGDFVVRSQRGLELFSQEQQELSILKKTERKKDVNGTPYSVGYEIPKWSPDGQWIAFFKMAEDEKEPPAIGVISKNGIEEKTFNFDDATNFEWASDSKHVLAINEGTINGSPLEVRIYNIVSGEFKSYLLEDPIENQKVNALRIIDTYGNKILLQAYIIGGGKQFIPLLLVDWDNGEKRLLTNIDYWSISAKFSPDGKNIAVTGDANKNSIEFIKLAE